MRTFSIQERCTSLTKEIIHLFTILFMIFMVIQAGYGQSNDLCVNATIIECGDSLIGESTDGATDQSMDTGCSMGTGVWYSFVGNGDFLIIDVTNNSIDMELAIMTGSCTNLNSVNCIDAGSSSETVSFVSEPGIIYYMYIGYWYSGDDLTGTFDLSVNCAPEPLVANDLCQDAIVLECGDTLIGESGVGASDQSSDTGCFMGPGIWYSVIGTGNVVTIVVMESTFDAEIALMSGSCDNLISLSCTDDNSVGETVSFHAESETFYYIYVGNWLSDGETGTFDLSISCAPLPIIPNDLCQNSKILECGDALIDEVTFGASDQSIDTDCSMGAGIWYSFVGTGDYTTIDIANSTVDLEVAIMTGSCDDLMSMSCSDNGTSTESISFIAEVETTYYIYAGFWTSGTLGGMFDLSITCVPVPIITNDICQSATILECGDSLTGESTIGATNQSMDTGCTMGLGIWYSIVGNGDRVTIDVESSSIDMEIAVMTGACDDLISDSCNDEGSFSESVSFTAELGTDYYFYIGHWFPGSSVGDFDLSVSCTPPPMECPEGFELRGSESYCYSSNEEDILITEVCPSSDSTTLCVSIQQGLWENTFDFLSIYGGEPGSGTDGILLTEPLTGDLSGVIVCSEMPGACLSLISNSDFSFSCATSGFESLEYNICESDETVSNIDILSEIKIQVFPNPTTDFVMLETDFEGSEIHHMKLFSLDGKMLLSRNITNRKERIDLASISNSGPYFIVVYDNKNKTVFKETLVLNN